MEKSRFICIHGHFYQPPRENPWLEEIEIQESAHPFHDWNERVAHECYVPNSGARILDAQGRLRHIINNYELISFDFGPTLLSWMESHRPDTYEAILAADQTSLQERSGHGNAIAQAYHHMIMPLASQRDKVTQVVWGLQDFRTRFRRDPEGMWLPETAVDRETLEIMVDHGIRFTILAPGQARRFRSAPTEPWVNLAFGDIDPSRPYRCHLSRGRSIVLFFYDGPISQAIAFQNLLNTGEDLKNRLLGAFSSDRTWTQLVNVATDGESYGHHHRFGEMALAYALNCLLRDPSARLTNYGEFLANHPPTVDVEVHENSAWSCAHGVKRWSEDCGCSVSNRPDWNQKWRRPLRKAMDLLRDRVDEIYEERATSLLKDPWQTRNDYVRVILGNGKAVGRFLTAHAARKLPKAERQEALRLLEMQRARMLMYTSCGWFFDDISGIEAMQVIRYAARVIQLARLFDSALEYDFLGQLKRARSNAKPRLNGAELFDQQIKPDIGDLDRVAAHVVISLFFEDLPERIRLYSWDVKIVDRQREELGERTLLTGSLSVLSRTTLERKEFIFAAIRFGAVDLRCSLRDALPEARVDSIRRELVEVFESQSSTELIRRLDEHFPGKYFRLRDLFTERRRELIDTVTRKMYEDQATVFETFYRHSRDLAKIIVTHGARLPDTFLAAARFVLDRRLSAELARLAQGFFPDQLQSVLEEMRIWKMRPDLSAAQRLIVARILSLTRELQNEPWDETIPQQMLSFLDLSSNLEILVHLGEAQIVFFRTVRAMESLNQGKVPPLFPELAERLAVRLNNG